MSCRWIGFPNAVSGMSLHTMPAIWLTLGHGHAISDPHNFLLGAPAFLFCKAHTKRKVCTKMFAISARSCPRAFEKRERYLILRASKYAPSFAEAERLESTCSSKSTGVSYAC